MKFTNNFGIKSRSTIDALTNDGYDLKDKPDNVLSCTEILDAPKVKILQNRHRDEITIDVSQRLWTLDGSAIHYAIEMANEAHGHNRLSEERMYLRISKAGVECFTLNDGEKIRDAKWYNPEDLFVSVKFDQYDEAEGVIEDNKRTSVWETIFGLKPQRMQQLNIGALALRLIGFQVNKLRAVLFLKDWTRKDRKSAVAKDGEGAKYPPIGYKEFEAVPASVEDQIQFMVNRATLHKSCGQLPDDNIPVCGPEERWYRGESVCVMKQGGVRAVKVFKVDGYDDPNTGAISLETAKAMAGDFMATKMMADTKGKYFIEHRPGTNMRCLEYCEVREFCNFGKTLVEENESEE